MKNKAKVTIKDKTGFILFVYEYLTLTKAKQSLIDNNFVKTKRITEKDKMINLDGSKLNLTNYVNSLENIDSKPKSQFLYRNTINRRYSAILEF